jgi:hypothetical protein
MISEDTFLGYDRDGDLVYRRPDGRVYHTDLDVTDLDINGAECPCVDDLISHDEQAYLARFGPISKQKP